MMLQFFCAFLADNVIALARPVLAFSCGRCWRARTASVGAAVVAALLRLVLALLCGHCWSCYQRCGTCVDAVDTAALGWQWYHSCAAIVIVACGKYCRPRAVSVVMHVQPALRVASIAVRVWLP